MVDWDGTFSVGHDGRSFPTRALVHDVTVTPGALSRAFRIAPPGQPDRAHQQAPENHGSHGGVFVNAPTVHVPLGAQVTGCSAVASTLPSPSRSATAVATPLVGLRSSHRY
jgi:hypothetical protein